MCALYADESEKIRSSAGNVANVNGVLSLIGFSQLASILCLPYLGKKSTHKAFPSQCYCRGFVPFSLALSFTFSFFLPIRFKSKSQRPRSSACYSNILFRYSILFVNGSILFLRSGNITVERNVIRHTHIKLLSMNFRDSHIHTKKITWAVGGHS